MADNIQSTMKKNKELAENVPEWLSHSFHQVDESMFNHFTKTRQEHLLKSCGATGIVSLIVDRTLYCANVGDCRALIVWDENGECVPMSRDHKAGYSYEKERIESLGVKLVSTMPSRSVGILWLSNV